MYSYADKVLIALTQLLNALIGGYPDESTSSRAYRLRLRPGWRTARRVIDGIFFWQPEHCRQAYLSELALRQFPPEMRDAQ